jgi:glutathione S-transferase
VEYADVESARREGGLRLVLTTGVPGPWGEAAKGLFHVKKIPYLPVAQEGGMPNEELLAWTGHDNAPQAVWEDEPARTGWAEILLLAERLEPGPALIPPDPRQRAWMFGLLHEIAGEDGFAWNRRLQLLHPILAAAGDAAPPPIAKLGRSYGYSPETAQRADGRVVAILRLLSSVLHEQRERGSDWLVGDALSAVDIYWAAFAAMVAPLPVEQCAMPEYLRASYTLTDAAGLEAADPILLEHRDRVYRDWLALPLDF